MSAQVLEVIDAAIRRIETQGVIPHADGLREARATVAALIAERDALREALEKIGRPQDCGCKPCTGRCRSQMALEIAIEEMQELARAALTTGESA